jgi:hypothetical protein
MSKQRSSRIAEQLGMSHGAAAQRLRKNLLFHLLKRLKENMCLVCKQEIVDSSELSIEHIKPWEGRSTDLFWDIENISFSHLSCNRPHVYRGTVTNRVCPEGKSWCWSCKDFKLLEEFHKNSDRVSGLQPVCISCRKSKRTGE